MIDEPLPAIRQLKLEELIDPAVHEFITSSKFCQTAFWESEIWSWAMQEYWDKSTELKDLNEALLIDGTKTGLKLLHGQAYCAYSSIRSLVNVYRISMQADTPRHLLRMEESTFCERVLHL